MCHHYEQEQLTTTEPISAEHAEDESDAESPSEERDEAAAPPAADD